MFRVRWAKDVVKEGRYFTTMVIPDAKSKNASAKNEPWVLVSQVDQCFFITDPSKPSRVVVSSGGEAARRRAGVEDRAVAAVSRAQGEDRARCCSRACVGVTYVGGARM